MNSRQSHWDGVYGTKAESEVSWYEARPRKSLELIRSSEVALTAPIIDVGGGASRLVDELVASGYGDVTVLDVSAQVLATLRERLGANAASVSLVRADVTDFVPERRYALWHDRAVFHFLIEPEERRRYVVTLERALLPNGRAIIATFGPEGPQRCSGLPVARYDAAALAAELGAHFVLAHSSLEIHRTPWGAEQQFLYCMFDRRGDDR